MSPEELINISLQQEVEIEPHTHIPAHTFLTFALEECNPLIITRLPLFAAIYLQKSNQCIIRTPPYLSPACIKGIIEKELEGDAFVELPEYFYEHASLFSSNEIDPMVLELRRTRQKKIWMGLNDMDGKALKINNLTRWEFNEIKDVIIGGMEMGKEIEMGSNGIN